MSHACPKCRAVAPALARFCPSCGAELSVIVSPDELSAAPPMASLLANAAPNMDGGGAVEGVIDLGFGRVVTNRVIGAGGMGSVYGGWLYFDPQGPHAGTAPSEVAVKMLHPSLRGRARVRQLFLGEAEALRRLSHPNIVRFLALAECDGALAIVMELVPGDPLSSVVARHLERTRVRLAAGANPWSQLPALPFVRAWHYFQQLLGALAATHELGIVHRDVKPANVLVRTDGLAKLTDYGIARMPADAARATGGLQPGTGAYMSPEQVLAQPLDGRSDLYSAAIVLFELVSGRTPFDVEGRSEPMVRAAQVEEPPPSFTSFVPQAPTVLDDIFRRALAKDPAARFPTAIDLGQAFRQALGLPDTMGWQAQQQLAKNALGIAGSPQARAREGTQPVDASAAAAMRIRVDAAYRDERR